MNNVDDRRLVLTATQVGAAKKFVNSVLVLLLIGFAVVGSLSLSIVMSGAPKMWLTMTGVAYGVFLLLPYWAALSAVDKFFAETAPAKKPNQK